MTEASSHTVKGSRISSTCYNLYMNNVVIELEFTKTEAAILQLQEIL